MESSRFRELDGPIGCLWQGMLGVSVLLGILFTLGVHIYLGWMLYVEQYLGLFLGLTLAAAFIGVPASAKAPVDRVPWYDAVFAVLGLGVGLYISVFYPQVALLFGYITADRVIGGIVAVLLVMEILRRMTGWVLVIVVGLFIAYGFVASSMPGPLHGTTTSLSSLANYLYLDSNSMLGMLRLSGTIALAFMFFGQILMTFGGSNLLNDFAISVFGRYRGGPAKAAVVGSSLAGTVTGGPVTNVMLTGPITIPLMIRSGYTPEKAGAIEAIASTGGQIMPPVMGVAAFLIADYLGVPYVDVVIAALVPAILYYLCVFFQVDLQAALEGNRGLSPEELPSLDNVLRNGWVILPALGVLIYTLFILRYDASTSGVLAAAVGVPTLLLRPEARDRFLSRLIRSFVDTGKSLMEVTIVLAAAGLIVGVTGITGLGFNMALALTRVGDQGLFMLLLVSAIVCVILGMGMPSVAAYALVAVLVAPAIVELGVDPMAAHLFIFYFAILSNFTPPIALACFAAAPIARTSPNRIGFEAIKLGVVAYIVPFLFVYSPTLILKGDVGAVVISVATAVLGTLLLSVALIGYFVKPMSMGRRVVSAVAGIGLLIPIDHLGGIGWIPNMAGFLLATLLFFQEWRERSVQSGMLPGVERAVDGSEPS